VHDEAQLVQKASYIELFRRRTVLRTVAATLIFGFQVQLTYGIGQWLPVLLIERGTPQADALTFAMILTFGQVAGTLVSSLVLDRFERKTTLAVAAAVVVIGYLLMGFIPTIPVLLIAGFIANIALSFVISATFTFVPEVFPSHIRGTGAGFANGIGRLAGVAGSFIISAVIIRYSTVGVFVYLAGVAFTLILITFMSPTTGVKQARREMKAASSRAKTEHQLR
jgi:putative MFS transporter